MRRRVAAALLAACVLSACSTTPPRGGASYKDDGPGANPPPNLDRTADAQPRAEPLSRAANRPYEVFGKRYVPLVSVQPFHQRGIASWYGRRFNGQPTSSGERYDMYAMSAAHPVLPIPSYARVTNLANGRSVVVRINDRGPFHSGRIIDLSYAAAHKLGYVAAGSTRVATDSLVPGGRTEPVVLRIVREALQNVRRHAVSRRAAIRAAQEDGRWVVEVRDDGRGFDVGAVAARGRRNFGLQFMRERAELIGAEFEVRSRPDGGTVVRIAIPRGAEESR